MLQSNKIYEYATNASLYFGASVIGFMLAVISMPLFSIYLTAAEFGIIGYFSSIGNFLFPLANLLFYVYYSSTYFKLNTVERQDTLNSLILFLLIWNSILFLLASLSLYLFFQIYRITFSFYPYAFIAIGIQSVGVYRYFAQIRFRLQKAAFRYFILAAGCKIAVTGLSIIAVACFAGGATGRLAGIFFGEAIFAVIAIVILLEKPFIINWHIIRDALKISLPLALTSLAFIPITNYDNIILERLNRPDELGLYNLGKGFAGYLNIFYLAIFQTIEPDIYKSVALHHIKRIISISLIFVAIIVISSLLYYASSTYIVNILTAYRYAAAQSYMDIFIFTNVAIGLIAIPSTILYALQKTTCASVVNIIGGVLSVILYNYLFKNYGFTGVAWGVTIVYTSILLLTVTASLVFLRRTA